MRYGLPMSRQPGRRSRRKLAIAPGTPTRGLHVWMPEESHERLSLMADNCSASMAVVLDALVRNVDIDPVTGKPRWWDQQVEAADHQEPLVS